MNIFWRRGQKSELNVFISEEIRWVAKYPFDKDARKSLELIALDIREYVEDDLKFLLEKAYERAYRDLEHRYSLIWDNDYQEAILFYLSVLIVRGIENEYIHRVFSDSESKRAYKLLRDDDIDSLLRISKNLGLDIKQDDDTKELLLNFLDFIIMTRYLSSIHWKLYNFEIKNGYVVLKSRHLARICSQKIKELIYKMIKEIPDVPEFIKNYSDRLKKEKKNMLKKIQMPVYSNVEENMFPPCIRKIMKEIPLGIPHTARFTLVTFLHRVGYSIDDIINVFRKTPDFNEKMTRYQVEHILGLKGSRKEYSVPSCKKIKSYGLCAADETCRYIRHPLQYVKKVREMKKK